MLGKNNLWVKFFCVRNKYWTQKNVGSKICFCPSKIFNPKTNCVNKNSPQKKFWSKTFCPIIEDNKNKGPKKFQVQKNVEYKNYAPQNIGSKNFRQNLVSISCQDKCWLGKCHSGSWNIF